MLKNEVKSAFIKRSLSGKLRIQMGEKSVLPALTKAILMTPPAQGLIIKYS